MATVYQCRDRHGSTYMLEAPAKDAAIAWMIATHGKGILPVSGMPAGDVMRLIRCTGVRPTRVRITPRVRLMIEQMRNASAPSPRTP